MTDAIRRVPYVRPLFVVAVTVTVLLATTYLGSHPSVRWLVLILAGIGAAVLLQQPIWGFYALVAAALIVPLEIGTGTEVKLNLAALLLPALGAVWVLDMVRRRDLHLVPSNVNGPLWLFLLAGLLSLLVGIVLWDPAVPRSGNFIVVQLAQWAIFAFSALALWLVANVVRDEVGLRRLTFFYLALAGSLAILRVSPGGGLGRLTTFALERAPFWLLLIAVAGGQLLFNRQLSAGWRGFLLVTVGAVVLYAFVIERKTLSNLVGVVPVLGVLAWLRWPRFRLALLAIAVISLAAFFPMIYDFAGGEAEWEESGGSRLALIGRVVEVTLRNPITGLGPAAYRPYARMEPLPYGRALWFDPQVNSHNNYVDLFSHVGLLGLGLFFWFAIEVERLGIRLRARFAEGFAAGYVSAMMAAWVGALAVMLMGDWILPFVYNIGFPGFQASVLVWLFLGGLVVLEQMVRSKSYGTGVRDGSKH